MLKNYGYNVIDMGKDVPCEDIVNKAIEENAKQLSDCLRFMINYDAPHEGCDRIV